MSTNPLNDISKVYLEQVAAVEEGVRPTPVDKPLDKAAFKKRRRSLAGKEKSAEARSRGHQGKEWYNSGRTYSPDEAKRMRSKLDDEERSTRHRSSVDPEGDDRLYSADKTKNPKKLRKQKAMGELGESSHLETDMKKRREANEKAIEDMKKTAAYKSMAATAAKKFDEEFVDPEHGEAPSGRSPLQNVSDHPRASVRKRAVSGFKAQMEKEYGGKWKSRSSDPVKEALDPVGHEDADVDNDGKKGTNADKYLLKRRKAIGKAISTQEAKEVKRWWDDDGDGEGYEEGEVSGKFKKKKTVKEGYSNWREDLVEVIGAIEKKKDDGKIAEKKVENKIVINPSITESIENLGGTLLEMMEIDEVDYIMENVYDELLDEGYDEDDIEEALEYALTEATVTFGHDTPTGEKKKGNLLKAVGRLARQKLSSKVRGAKTAAKQAVATGARKVAKGALGVARKVEGGDKTASPVHSKTRTASTYRGAGAGQKERVSSGSYTPPTKKKAEKPADPWEGSATTPPKAKPKAATKKAAAPKAKAPAATKRKRKSKLDDLLASVRSESVIGNRARNAVADDRLDVEQEKTNASMNKLRQQNKRFDRALASDAARKVERDVKKSSAYGPQRLKPGTVTGRRIEDPKSTGSKATGYRIEETQLDEKTLTAAETKEKERIVKSMKDKAADFEKRYPGRGKEVMYATATKMAKKIAEQAMELQPKTQPQPKEKPLDTAIERQKYTNLKMVQQRQQQLQKQKLNLQRQGKLPLETD
jgi:hypothetical protein